jgi:hypothetical protein
MNRFAISQLSLALALSACSGTDKTDVDLGDDKLSTVAASLEDYEGTWVGYAEAYQFDSDSDHLSITLDEQGNGAVAFGEAAPIPPFSNPNVGYPVDELFDDFEWSLTYYEPRAGFSYPVHDATVESGRIRFNMWGTDLVNDWCAAQTPLYDDESQPAAYTCSPAGIRGYSQNGEICYSARPDDPTPYDCGQLKTCYIGCSCEETACSGAKVPGLELKLDAAIESETADLVGTLVIGDDRITVRLQRQ